MYFMYFKWYLTAVSAVLDFGLFWLAVYLTFFNLQKCIQKKYVSTAAPYVYVLETLLKIDCDLIVFTTKENQLNYFEVGSEVRKLINLRHHSTL